MTEVIAFTSLTLFSISLSYLVSHAASYAYFQQKLLYHRKLIAMLEKGSENGTKQS